MDWSLTLSQPRSPPWLTARMIAERPTIDGYRRVGGRRHSEVRAEQAHDEGSGHHCRKRSSQ